MGKTQQMKRQTPMKQVVDVGFVQDDKPNDKSADKKSIFTPPQPLPETSIEVRQSGDGGWYTKAQFQSYFKGLSQWRTAKRHSTQVTERESKKRHQVYVMPMQGGHWRVNNAFAVLA